ncbi:MAG: DUF4493 domain-containing protein [Imperialibacter sp.]
MKTLKAALLSFLFLAVACQQQSETPEPLDYGYLSLNLSLTITSEEANGRTLAVSTDDFRVTIFAADGTEVMVFDPFSTAPAEVSLPTGEYYVEAHSNNLVDAAFENPYYFGRSDNFTIDKEELKSIDIEAELANTKVAINYSTNVVNTFHSYTGTVTVASSGASLFYAQGETREGYFLTSPLDIEVNLSYTKLDGTTIDRTFTASIGDPQPKTLYNINVDATLEDGKVVFNITVDEGFDTVEVELGESASSGAEPSFFISFSNLGAAKVIETIDGGYLLLLADNSVQSYGSWDARLVKTDVNGNILWQQHYGGTGHDVGSDLIEDSSGNIYIVGNANSTDLDLAGDNIGQSDGWVIKTDNMGNLIWDLTVGTTSNDRLAALDLLSNGNIVTTGSVASFGDIFVAEITPSGTLVSSRTIAMLSVDEGYSISATDDGGYILLALSRSNPARLGNYDGYLEKVSSNGVVAWNTFLGGSGVEIPSKVLAASDGYYVAGISDSSDGDLTGNVHAGNNGWICKVNLSGGLVFSNTYGGDGIDGFSDAVFDINGDLLIIGTTYSANGDLTADPSDGNADLWVLRIDPSSSGNIIHSNTVWGLNGDFFSPSSIAETSSKNVLALGQRGGYAFVDLLKLQPDLQE